MKLSDILKEIYNENKKTIRMFLGLFLAISVFLCGTGVFAGEISSLEDINVGGTFTNGLNSALVFLFPEIEPCIGFGITAILAILGDYSLLPNGMGGADFGLLGYSWIFRIVILIWCVLSILPRYFGVTRIGGLCIERINDKYVGTVVIILNIFPRLLQYTPAESAMAAEPGQLASLGAAVRPVGIAYSLLTFLGLCLMLAMYYVIRLFMMFIDILILPVNCLIPGTSLLVETAKFIFSIFMAVNSIFNPVVFIVFYAIILILSLIFFKKAYLAVKYFKNVYMLPLWHKMSGSNNACIPVSNKIPGKVLRYLSNRQCKYIIPIYATKVPASYAQIDRFDQLWMVIYMNNAVSVCKPYKDSVIEIPLENTFESKMFINNSLLYIELFKVYSEQGLGARVKNAQKGIQYVISKDYLPIYYDIQVQTGFVDYAQYIKTVNPGSNKWDALKKLF